MNERFVAVIVSTVTVIYQTGFYSWNEFLVSTRTCLEFLKASTLGVFTTSAGN